MRSLFRTFAAFALTSLALTQWTNAADVARLSPQNWDELVPQGKEVDCIYGDIVLRNSQLVAVIGEPKRGRNANMTVRAVGGMIIDLTRRGASNDQLSCYYPGASFVEFVSLDDVTVLVDGKPVDMKSLDVARGREIVLECRSTVMENKPQATNRYRLVDDEPFLVSQTDYVNPHAAAISFEFFDSIRADKFFEFGQDAASGLFWAYDDWFGQAYGVVVAGREVKRVNNNRGSLLHLLKDGTTRVTLEPGAKASLDRKVFPADNLLQLKSLISQVTNAKAVPVSLDVVDSAGPVNRARVKVKQGDSEIGSARTSDGGHLEFSLPEGEYSITVDALGRPAVTKPLKIPGPPSESIRLPDCGYVVGKITAASGSPIPCKVAFHGKNGTPSPNFGPDGASGGVRELVYSHNGSFRQEIAPGEYDVIISYGPEYDAVFTSISVQQGKSTELKASLERVVDTAGWVSSDFHNHSSPSGDNASSQLGRVLNLLCEHIEFAPCTEHNRIDTYVPHLKHLDVEKLMATCSGMELTGSPLPINHQNAFPLKRQPRTQDGGGPVTDESPVVQIERLAMWDNGSDKLVQENHPDLLQILGDKDLDGKADGGFHQMFGFMDVVEVHPPEGIFTPPTRDEKGKVSRNPIFHWMQMLNLGYRIPGVVNTDAHYTYHDSGWLRNYLRCSTDDPAGIDTMDMVHAAEKGQLTMTTGPFLQVELTPQFSNGAAKAAGPGDDVASPGGKASLRVRVQSPNWFDVNRVQVFLNGRPDPKLNFTRREKPDHFGNGVVKFEQTIPLELASDTHVIVATIGEGLGLGLVFGPDKGKIPPVAVSNPIFVDVDGSGFKANGDLLDFVLPLEKTPPPAKR